MTDNLNLVKLLKHALLTYWLKYTVTDLIPIVTIHLIIEIVRCLTTDRLTDFLKNLINYCHAY